MSYFRKRSIEDVDGRLPKGILDPFPATGILSDVTWVNTLGNAEAHNIGVRFIPASRKDAGKVMKLPRAEMVPSALNTLNQRILFDDAPPDNNQDGVPAHLLFGI